MNKAVLYKQSNSLQRRDAKEVIDEFLHMFNWHPDGTDSLLDVGCGSADVMIDLILPKLPTNFTRLVGVDISEKMIRHAREQYIHPRIHFEQMDISTADVKKLMRSCMKQPFDHITSFYCLHWIQDQKRTLSNIFTLLRPGGDCLLVFLAYHPIFEVYREMAKIEEWSKYMVDVNDFIGPYHETDTPGDAFGKQLHIAGFSEYSIEVLDKVYITEGLDVLRNSLEAVNPFVERVPKDKKNNYMDDLLKVVDSVKCIEIDNTSSVCRFFSPYTLIVAYAKK